MAKTVHQLNRQQWLTIKTIGQKIATYRGFTSEQKHKFWHDKLEEVKMLDWNSEELKHIDTNALMLGNILMMSKLFLQK